LGKVENSFELVLKASHRAHALANGAQPLVEALDDKPTVIALREIAEGHLDNYSITKEHTPRIRF
jgi:DNA-directed RNA polymerase subunit omega